VEKVSVSRGLLVGVVAVAAASLLALAFVLGRASGPGSPSVQPSGRELPSRVDASRDPAPRAPDPPLPPPPQAAAPMTELPDMRSTAMPAPAPTAGERGSAGLDPDRAAVATYLDAVDHVQPGKMSGDAEGLANEMAAALARGDTSGLDRMIRETEAAKESLAGLAPPAPCAALHRESLGSLDDALEMLRLLKAAMESPDAAARLSGVTTRAAALRSRSEALEKEELALRRRYGLAR
jgi:hypothetical protein